MSAPARRCLLPGPRLIVLLLLATPQASLAAESAVDDRPAPTSVEEMSGTADRGFEKRQAKPAGPFRQWLHTRTQAPFLRDTELELGFRTYYFARKNEDGSREETFATGGSLLYQSGRWRDFLSVGGELFTSQRLYGPDDRDGLELLRPRQTGLTVLGSAHLDLTYRDFGARLYRQEFDMPYLNRHDSRMVPNTFEAYALRGELSRLELIGAHVTQMKTRDSRDFVSMSEAAGAEGSKERGVSFLGARFQPREGVSIAAVDYYGWDVMNTFYTEGDYTADLGDGFGLKLSGQFTHQASIGENLLGGPSFDTHVWGARAALSRNDVILRVAFSSTADDAQIQAPYGSYPGYVSLMKSDFDRAGEQAWTIGASYHFKRVPGLSAFSNFARGSSARDATTGDSLPNRHEFDVTLDYHRPAGRLKDFWIRLRYAHLDEDGADSAHDIRVILNYQIPIF